MKPLILIAILFLSACTTITATSPDGRSVSYASTKEFKEVRIKYSRDGDSVTADIKVFGVEENLSEKVIDGVVKGLTRTGN